MNPVAYKIGFMLDGEAMFLPGVYSDKYLAEVAALERSSSTRHCSVFGLVPLEAS